MKKIFTIDTALVILSLLIIIVYHLFLYDMTKQNKRRYYEMKTQYDITNMLYEKCKQESGYEKINK